MKVLAKDVIARIFDCTGNSETLLKAGMRIDVLKVAGSVTTCGIGNPTYSIAFTIPSNLVIEADEAEDEQISEEEMKEAEEFAKQYHQKAEEGKGEAVEENEGPVPEGYQIVKAPKSEDLTQAMIDALPENAQHEILPTEYQGRAVIDIPPEEWAEVMRGLPDLMFYPDQGPNEGRFLVWFNKRLFSYGILDLKTSNQWLVGDDTQAKAAADAILNAEAWADKPGIYGGYIIRVNHEPWGEEVPPSTTVTVVNPKTKEEVATVGTYDEAKAKIEELLTGTVTREGPSGPSPVGHMHKHPKGLGRSRPV